MLQRIMVALDGSPLAEQAAPFASALARAFGAEIILLRVVETPSGSAGRALDSFDWRMDRAQAIEYLERIKAQLHDEGIAVDLDVTSGRASEEILEMGSARDVDLVVLGSHGSGGVSQFRMASTAHKVVFASDMSVLVVPAREDVASGAPFDSVLVPVDGSPHGDWAVAMAATLARFHGVDLVVLHIVRTPTLMDPQGVAHERQIVDELVTMNRRAASRYMAGVKSRLECPEMAVHSRVVVADDIAPELERQANGESQPLLVLSARGDSRFDDGPYGSLVTVMLANTGHPVLVLREPSRKNKGRRRWFSSADATGLRRATIPSE